MNLPPSRVLLIEDDVNMPEALSPLLIGDNVALKSAFSAAEALSIAARESFDLILLDLGLPDMNGFELLQKLKHLPETRSIPIILLTAWNGTKDKLGGFAMGAVDYVTKPFEAPQLVIRPVPCSE